MSRLVNHAEAIAFLNSIPDPIVQALIQHAHALIFTDASSYFTTDFDLLLFYKVLEALFRDREKLANFLTTEIPEGCFVQQGSGELTLETGGHEAANANALRAIAVDSKEHP